MNGETPRPSPSPAARVQADTTVPPAANLPFSGWVPLLVGAGVAFVIRLLFRGAPGGPFSAMLGAFIYLAPAVCGAVTVYAAERIRRRSIGYYLWAPWVATALFVAGTLLVFIEGLICAIVIVPLFAVMGSLGGLAMGLVCRITHWPKQAVHAFVLLPLVLGAIEPMLPNPDRFSSTTRSVFVAAPADAVWHELNNVRDIRAAEIGGAWAWRIGVPMPVEGVTRERPEGRVREVRWQKNVHFEEVVAEWSPPHRLRWTYRFSPDSFPRGALDDHVLIGGHYFDLRETTYTLTPRAGGTELRIDVAWRVSTRFNWYADRVAHFLLGDFSEHILGLYKARAEQATIAG
ncbi:MAG: hypothetical protein REJ24_19640 [Rhodocyclaceae bacterium]|nr:hypothetical protein [Rhodocyclaceae bacterium]MDQ8001362.1 SRPBCC domain-containing protein [Pseudomonadota bacterium]